MKIIVSGALANKPFNGGNAWSRMSWVLGFKKLGFDVWFVEQIDHCVDAVGSFTSFDGSASLDYFRTTMEQFGLAQSSSLIYQDGKHIYGLPLTELTSVAQQADVLFNMSGHLTHAAIKDCIRCKIYYDDDPGFTQFWHALSSAGARLDHHDFYFTLGANIGVPGCPIPTGQIHWRHTRPPVFLDEWPVNFSEFFERFTTVASWRGAYAPIQYGNQTYGVKAHEFRKFITMPQHTQLPYEIALQIDQADKKDLQALIDHGWRITDPRHIASSLSDFRQFVQNSSAEFSVAQGVYVGTNSGWFSDRTVRYLASGKPVLVQDTGFSRNYPVGEGLLAFRTVAEAVDGARRIVCDYKKHCHAARRIAQEYFNAEQIIRELLLEVGIQLP